MKTILSLATLCAAFNALGDAIPLTATRSSQASASVTDGVLVGTPQNNNTGPLTTFGALTVNQNAFDEVIDSNPGGDRHGRSGATANQQSTIDGKGVTASIFTEVSIDVRGTWLLPSRAGTQFAYTFELTAPHTFDLSINCVVAPTLTAWSGGLLAAYTGPGGMIIMSGDHSETQTGLLGPGTYSLSFFADFNNTGFVSGNLKDTSSASLDISFLLTPVPDTGASLAFGLMPLALFAIKRRL